MEPILHIVHAIDTEGPLDEDILATFDRLKQLFDVDLEPSRETLSKLQKQEIALGEGLEERVAQVVAPSLLNYNRSWPQIQSMLDEAMSQEFRRQMVDDFDNGWVYSWHCVDHMGYASNPRHKDMGYGNVFRYYRQIIDETKSIHDELNWHFHPLSITKNPLSAATSYNNAIDLITKIWCQRIVEDQWFPTTNRPGFHSERSDANLFLEQWLPFDYANQSIEEQNSGQNDTLFGRFGDWSRAPQNWLGYHPSLHDYQSEGDLRRWIFRCLNVGTRFRNLTRKHLQEAFTDANEHGSAILAFADHDYRDLRKDVNQFRELLSEVRGHYPNVKIKFNGAHAAAMEHIKTRPNVPLSPTKPAFTASVCENRLFVEMTSGELIGSQPFLALRSKSGEYYHDNFDILSVNKRWTYIFDEQTISLDSLDKIGVGAAGRYGHYHVEVLDGG